MNALVAQTPTKVRVLPRREVALSLLAALASALALIGMYLAILSLGQSPAHALEQLSQDILPVGAVAAGLATQVGLYVYLRAVVRSRPAGGAGAMGGVGTGTSTIGMVACCAHHVTDVAPLLGLAGFSALSGAASLLNEWKVPIILLGLGMNAVGIVLTLGTIRQSRSHLAFASEGRGAASAYTAELTRS